MNHEICDMTWPELDSNSRHLTFRIIVQCQIQLLSEYKNQAQILARNVAFEDFLTSEVRTLAISPLSVLTNIRPLILVSTPYFQC